MFRPFQGHHREGCIQPPDNNDGLSTIYSVWCTEYGLP